MGSPLRTNLLTNSFSNHYSNPTPEVKENNENLESYYFDNLNNQSSKSATFIRSNRAFYRRIENRLKYYQQKGEHLLSNMLKKFKHIDLTTIFSSKYTKITAYTLLCTIIGLTYSKKSPVKVKSFISRMLIENDEKVICPPTTWLKACFYICIVTDAIFYFYSWQNFDPNVDRDMRGNELFISFIFFVVCY